VDCRSAVGERLLQGQYRLKRLVFDLHRLRPVLGQVAALGNDERDLVSCEPHLFAGEDLGVALVVAGAALAGA
jgi:hypothetical protein